MLYRHPSRNNITKFLLYKRIFHMAIPAKEVSYLHSFLTRQLQRQHFDKPVGRSNLEIRFLIGYNAAGLQIMCDKDFLRFKIFNASGAASP